MISKTLDSALIPDSELPHIASEVLDIYSKKKNFFEKASEASVHSQLCGVILQQRKTDKRQVERQ